MTRKRKPWERKPRDKDLPQPEQQKRAGERLARKNEARKARRAAKKKR